VLLAVAATVAHAEPPVAELESFAQKNLAPKLDLMCGSRLAVHYDESLQRRAQQHDNDRTEGLCELPLRWMFYACSEEAGRREIASAHLKGYVCRVAKPGERASIQVADGVMTATWLETGNLLSERVRQLERQLGVQAPVSFAAHYVGHDPVWSAFVAAPAPAVTSTSYCEIDGRKTPLPTTGDPIVPPTSRVRCVSKGKVITDLVPDVGGYTGFSTVMEENQVIYRSWRNGSLDGERWRRLGKVVVERATYTRGHQTSLSLYSPDEGKLTEHDSFALQASTIRFRADGAVTELECGDSAASDAMFRDYCGYDRPRQVTVHDANGTHLYTYDKGQITSVKD